MTVSLPRAQKDYVRERAEASGCSTPSEHIRRLIHADQESQAQRALEKKLLVGMRSPARKMSNADWSELRMQLSKKLASRRKK